MGSKGEGGIRDEVPEEEIAEQKGQQTSACSHRGGEQGEKTLKAACWVCKENT